MWIISLCFIFHILPFKNIGYRTKPVLLTWHMASWLRSYMYHDVCKKKVNQKHIFPRQLCVMLDCKIMRIFKKKNFTEMFPFNNYFNYSIVVKKNVNKTKCRHRNFLQVNLISDY